MSVTREQVVAEAREWLGTPFEHQAISKGVACDCRGLIIGVARELALVSGDFDVNGYPKMPDGSMLELCGQHMRPVPFADMKPGHVLVVAFDRDPQHMAFLSDYRYGGLAMIHSSNVSRTEKMPLGGVVEHRLMFHERMRFMAAFALPGVVD